MKLFWSYLLLAAALFVTVRADLSSAASLLPKCGLECTVSGIEQSTCAATNQTCICTNTELADTINKCVKSKCTIKEQLTTKNVSMTTCGAPIRAHTKLISGFGVGGGVLALTFCILRTISRLTLPGSEFGIDDCIIYVVMILLSAFSALSVPLAKAGFGRDIWTVPFENITFILLIYYIDEQLYLVVVSLTKISILFFYLRIFPDRNFRRAVYAVMTCTVLYMLAFILVSLFQCWPVDHAWKHWHHEHPGSCSNVNAQGWAAAIFNIILDLATIILPLPQLYKLVMNWKKKVQLLLMFAVGGFVTLVSILRLETLMSFAKSANFTWDGAPFGYWSTIEMDVGVMCACMPALHSLFARMWPRIFGNTTRGKSTGRSGTSKLSASIGAERPQKAPKGNDTKDFIPLVDVNTVDGTLKEDSDRNDV